MNRHDRQMHRDIARRFSGAAIHYDAHAEIQRQSAERLVNAAGDITPRRILDLGCGTGLLSRVLHARWPDAELTGIDIAPAMLDRYREALRSAKIRSYAADITCLAAQPAFDLVASNCVLHWIQPLLLGVERLAGQLRPGGTALVSIMLDGTLGELHDARRAVAPDATAESRLPRLDELSDAFVSAGLRIRSASSESIRQIAPDARSVLAMVRAQGVTGGPLARGKRPLLRGELEALTRLYEERHRHEHGVTVTWSIGYLCAEKTS